MSAGAEDSIMELRFPARPERMQRVRQRVRDALAECGLDPLTIEEIVLAISEACQNVIKHGYANIEAGDIELTLMRDGDRLVVRITDFAPAFDPAFVEPRDLTVVRPGGLGIYFITELMDTAECLPGPGGVGNVLRMTRKKGISP